ncbi:MAG: hypothetical protein JW908_03210 [Anaerolineales bacterium]|nr:hypothetical protein [Anaerolineales bacterium]
MEFKKIVTILVLFALLIGAAMVGSRQSIAQASSLADAEGIRVPYSWTLSDATGKAAKDGVYAFTFELYDAKEGGDLLWSEQQSNVKVSGGKVNVELGTVTPIPASLLDEKDARYWLAVSLRGSAEASFTDLSPLQSISLSPQSTDALSCPHNHFTDGFSGSNSEYGLLIENTSTGDGLRAYSSSTAYNYAAVFAANVANVATGNGGPAVYGYSENGYGGTFYSGTYRGLYAEGPDMGGYFEGNANHGVYGTATSTTLPGAATIAGVYGASALGRGVLGVDGGTNSDDNYAVYAQGDMRTTDDLYVYDDMWVTGYATFSGGKSGFVVDVAQNDDTVALEAGDVVVISGAGEAVLGEIPVIKVRRATQSDCNAIVGVVDQHFTPAPKSVQINGEGETKIESVIEEEAIQPGEYLTVVTLGAYKMIKVDASFGAINPGDLLVASSNPGYAMVSHDPKVGTVIGKALESLDSGTGTIAVLIAFQ